MSGLCVCVCVCEVGGGGGGGLGLGYTSLSNLKFSCGEQGVAEKRAAPHNYKSISYWP